MRELDPGGQSTFFPFPETADRPCAHQVFCENLRLALRADRLQEDTPLPPRLLKKNAAGTRAI
jgi:hypothetical protein